MSKFLKSALRQLSAETSGAEIAETAAVLPLLFMFIMAIFWFGQAFSQYGTITRAAQDGARAGATPVCSTCTSATSSMAQNAANAVQSSLAAANLNVNAAQWPSPQPSLNACGSGGARTCDSTASANVCVQAPVQLSSTVPGGSGVCGVSVTFRYPFQFTLPFTTLNNKQIWITASARVRMENQ